MAGFSYSVRIKRNDLAAVIRDAPEKIDRRLARVAFDGERIVKTSFGTGGKGRTYRRGSRTHTASAPGSPPAIDTNKLRGGINTKKLRLMLYSINTGDTEYAPHLEFGTSKMAARPFMGPAAKEIEKILPDAFKDLF